MIERDFPGLEGCIEEASGIEQTILRAISEFEKETFSGVKAGLKDLGSAIKQMTALAKDCKDVTKEVK